MAGAQTTSNNKSLKNGIHILISALLALLLSFSILRYITGTYSFLIYMQFNLISPNLYFVLIKI